MAFSPIEAFRLFDQEGKGYLTEEDLAAKFEELGLTDAEPSRILGRFDRDRDGRLDLSEFTKMINPINYEYQGRGGSSHWGSKRYAQKTSPAQLAQFKTEEWIDDLKEVLFTISVSESYLIDVRNGFALNGEELFNQIDAYKMGYLTSRGLGEWLAESVGFRLNDFEIKLIFNRYDKNGDYTINLGEFVEEVNAKVNIEEYDSNEQEAEMEGEQAEEERPAEEGE